MKRSRWFRGLQVVLALLPPCVWAAPGDLDSTFGVGGVVTTPIGAHADVATGVAIDAGGRIVVAGTTDVPGLVHDLAVARYTSTGALDPTFGSGGTVTKSLALYEDITQPVYRVVIDGSGRVVVGGYAFNPALVSYDFAVVRYTASGALDSTFGGGMFGSGTVITHLGGYEERGRGLMIDGGGRIILAGYTATADFGGVSNGDVGVARYTASGALDGTFGSGGTVTTPIGSGNDVGNAMRIDGSGRIVVAGSNGADFVVLRYLGGPSGCE